MSKVVVLVVGASKSSVDKFESSVDEFESSVYADTSDLLSDD